MYVGDVITGEYTIGIGHPCPEEYELILKLVLMRTTRTLAHACHFGPTITHPSSFRLN